LTGDAPFGKGDPHCSDLGVDAGFKFRLLGDEVAAPFVNYGR
jgi:hypothetical protein